MCRCDKPVCSFEELFQDEEAPYKADADQEMLDQNWIQAMDPYADTPGEPFQAFLHKRNLESDMPSESQGQIGETIRTQDFREGGAALHERCPGEKNKRKRD